MSDGASRQGSAPGVGEPVWTPTPDQIRDARMTAFMRFARERGARGVLDYPSLWRWSVEYPEQLWPAVWKCLSVVAEERALELHVVARRRVQAVPAGPVLGVLAQLDVAGGPGAVLVPEAVPVR